MKKFHSKCNDIYMLCKNIQLKVINYSRYGAPSDEIEETLKIAEAKKATSIKKEPTDESTDKKGKHQEKRNIIRPSQVRSFVNMLRSTNYD